MTAPLAGIRVIDFGRFIAGPYCAMLLADMGADVIRVDRRQGSEDRYTGPVTEQGEGGAFISLNRNKRSVTLDTSKRECGGDRAPAGEERRRGRRQPAGRA